MEVIAHSSMILALFGLGGGEIILILALILILFGAKRLPDLARGLGRGLFEFGDAAKQVADELDDEAHEAGRSVGGIYGQPAAQALTPDNQIAELYDPAVFDSESQQRCRRRGVKRLFNYLWRRLCRIMKSLLPR